MNDLFPLESINNLNPSAKNKKKYVILTETEVILAGFFLGFFVEIERNAHFREKELLLRFEVVVAHGV